MNLEEIKPRDTVEDKAKAYNAKSKAAAHFFGKNLSMIVCLLLPVLFVFSIWTRPSLNASVAIMGDFAMTIVIFLAGQRAALNVGVEGGKLDDEYLAAWDEYREEREKVYQIGISELQTFCESEISQELEAAYNAKCRKMKISREQLDQFLKMPIAQVAEQKGKVFAAQIAIAQKMEPINLSDDMLLSDGRETAERGGLGEGAEEHLEKRWMGKRGAAHIAMSILTVIFSVGVSFVMADGVSLALVVYTLYKMVLLLFRMAGSYRDGAAAYNSYEVNYLRKKSKYLRKYREYMGDKKDESEEVHETATG